MSVGLAGCAELEALRLVQFPPPLFRKCSTWRLFGLRRHNSAACAAVQSRLSWMQQRRALCCSPDRRGRIRVLVPSDTARGVRWCHRAYSFSATLRPGEGGAPPKMDGSVCNWRRCSSDIVCRALYCSFGRRGWGCSCPVPGNGNDAAVPCSVL